MPSTYSPLKIQLMATGENNTTWGDVTNLNLGTAIEEAIVGSADVTFASGDVTLTLTDTNASQTARNMRLRCTGTTGGSTRNLVVPSIEKPYIVKNDCADSVTVKTAAGTGITVPTGKTMWVYSDGTNVVDAVTHLSSLTLSTDLSVADGGTGASTFTANGVLYGNGASALQVTAAGTTGQVLVGNTGSAPSWATLTSTAVTSISFGSTGLTPSTATQGAVTVAGTLGVANGGTGTSTQFTAGSVVFAGASGVYTQDNANLFWDNANDRLGIGTSSPTQKLDVNGSIAVSTVGSAVTFDTTGAAQANYISTVNDFNIRMFCGRGVTSSFTAASDSAQISTNNTERMRIDSSGNVGIGTTTANGILSVVGNQMSVGSAGGSSSLGIQIKGTTLSAIPAAQVQSYIATGNSSMGTAGDLLIAPRTDVAANIRFITGTTPAERMRIDYSGNVGIGTSSPTALLTVSNAGAAGYEVNPTGGVGGGATVATYNRSTAAYTSLTTYASTMTWYAGGSTRAMDLDSSGNVGIGTSSPGAKLHVDTGASTGTSLIVGAVSASSSQINMGIGVVTAGRPFIGTNTNTNPLEVGTRAATDLILLTNTTERMRLNAAGDVGIGTSNPLGKLHINGNFLRIDQAGANLAFFGNAADLITGAPAGAGIRFDGTALRIAAASSEIAQFTSGGSFLVGLTSPVLGERLGVSGSIITQGTGGGEVGLFGTFGGSTQVIGAYSNVPVEFRTNNQERMRIDSSGNVGIGTSSPGSKLTVLDGTSNTIATLTSSASALALLRFTHTTDGGVYVGSSGSSGVFYTNGSERMRIDSSGNLLVGTTTSTGKKLTLAGSADMSMVNTANTSGFDIGLLGGSSDATAYVYQRANSAMVFGTNNAERMRIDSSGNVGIGEASAGARLQVSAANSNSMRLYNTAGTGTILDFVDQSWQSQIVGSAGNILFNTGGTTERMRITAVGNLQLGTASLATTATDGFPYIPTCAGTPTGTPTAITGYAPMVVDSTNNKLYVYVGGAWQAMN